jgi:hypothetical protein
MVKETTRSKKRIEYTIRIGPELMAVIEHQMKKIKDVTYGIVKDSPWEAGEIIARKYLGKI